MLLGVLYWYITCNYSDWSPRYDFCEFGRLCACITRLNNLLGVWCRRSFPILITRVLTRCERDRVLFCSFATKNSVHLGRFRVKNATVRAGKRVYYGLRLYTRLFGVGNATVWGWKRNFMGFCNIMFEVVFLFFAFFAFVLLNIFITTMSSG